MRKVILNRQTPIEIYDELIELGRDEYKKYNLSELSRITGIHRVTLAPLINKKRYNKLTNVNATGSNRLRHILYILGSLGISVSVSTEPDSPDLLITDQATLDYIRKKVVDELTKYKGTLVGLENLYDFPRCTMSPMKRNRSDLGLVMHASILEALGHPVYLLLKDKNEHA